MDIQQRIDLKSQLPDKYWASIPEYIQKEPTPVKWTWPRVMQDQGRSNPMTLDRRTFAFAKTWAVQRPGARALDICTGAGAHANSMAKAGLSVTAFDIDPIAIQYAMAVAASYGLRVKFEIGDMLDMKYTNGYFTFATAFKCLYLTNMDRMRRAASEIDRILEPGGQIIGEVSLKSEEYEIYQEMAPDAFIDSNTAWVASSKYNPEPAEPRCYISEAELESLFPNFEIKELSKHKFCQSVFLYFVGTKLR